MIDLHELIEEAARHIDAAEEGCEAMNEDGAAVLAYAETLPALGDEIEQLAARLQSDPCLPTSVEALGILAKNTETLNIERERAARVLRAVGTFTGRVQQGLLLLNASGPCIDNAITQLQTAHRLARLCLDFETLARRFAERLDAARRAIEAAEHPDEE